MRTKSRILINRNFYWQLQMLNLRGVCQSESGPDFTYYYSNRGFARNDTHKILPVAAMLVSFSHGAVIGGISLKKSNEINCVC